MKQLSPQDATFLYMESDNNCNHVTSLNIYDPSAVANGGRANFKDIVEHIKSRLHYSPFMTQRLIRLPFEMDFPYWVEAEFFDVEDHVQLGSLPQPASWRDFCDHIARYHSRPLNPKRPLWEMYVVEGLDSIEGMPKGCYAIATKIHHAAVDGAAMVRFFGTMHDIDSKGTPVLAINEPAVQEHHAKPSMKTVFKRALFSNLGSPIKISDAVMRMAPSIYSAAQEYRSNKADSGEKTIVPVTRFNDHISPHKNFDATIFLLNDLKAIRKSVAGATINDVVLAICSGGLRKYLQIHNELPDEPLVAWVPINTRSSDDKAEEGNNISAMTTPIYTNVEQPLSRLDLIQQATRQSKEAKSGVSAKIMTDLSKHIPAATQLMASRMLIKNSVKLRMCNLFVSNLPGPQQAYYMHGAKVMATYGMTPINDGMGLFINTPSYDGKMMFNVVSTREIMPDIDCFIECLEASMAELIKDAKKMQARLKTTSA